MTVRVLLASDAPLYREGIALTLTGRSAIEIAATAVSAEQTLDLVRRLLPEIVLLDMAMPQAFDAARRIAQLDRARVVALGIAEIEREVLACAEAGVAGYVPRAGSVHDAVAVIEAVARGEARCSPQIVGSLLRRIAALTAERHVAAAKGALAGLTAREAEIFALLQQGLSNKLISRRLGIELSTVKNHVHSVLSKLGVHRRTEAAVLAFASGPMPADDAETDADDCEQVH
jgi:two-component system, NarL family, nitrate/nitrite response regulator NarL